MRIFVSHSSRDADFSSSLVQALRAAGADVWYDEQNLGAGILLEEIQREIKRSDVFLVILSAAALSSPWVRDECQWAYNRRRRKHQPIILPVLAQSISDDAFDDWLFLESFRRIGRPGGIAYPKDGAIVETLRALGLTAEDQESTRAQDEDAANAEELVLKGQALVAAGKHERALAFFEKATRVDPEDSATWLQLGEELFLLADVWATSTLSEILREAAKDRAERTARHDRGQTLKHALQAYERALKLDPSSDYTWFEKGRVLAELHRYTEALAAFETAASIAPDESLVLCARGEMLLALGRLEEALAAYNHVLAMDPNDELARDGKANVQEEMARKLR